MKRRTSAAVPRVGVNPVVAAPTLELECGDCGYGVVVRHTPPACPMCAGKAWVPTAWRPFTRPPAAA